MVKLIQGDCLEVMKDLEDKSIDLVVVDLPYGQTCCEWDTKIDLSQMWIELKKICKKNCTYCFFTTTKFGNELINSNPKWFRYDLVWKKSKSVGFLSSKKLPLRQHEMIYVFGNPSVKKTYNPQMREGFKPWTRKGKPDDIFNNVYGKCQNYMNSGNDKRFPVSVLKFNSIQKAHKTQKPVDLCEWLVKSYSNEGDTVLDFTMGSGSTGEACVNTKREFIGIEKDDEIFKIAYDRLHLYI